MLMLQAIFFPLPGGVEVGVGLCFSAAWPRDASLLAAAEKHALTIIDGRGGIGKGVIGAWRVGSGMRVAHAPASDI